MATLTETAYYTRKIIKIGAVLIASFFALRILARWAGVTWKRLNPPKPPAPTVYFGKLPPIYFPESKDSSGLTFKLETVEGTLPTLPAVGKVFFIPKEIYTYLTYEKAINAARSLGFRNEPKKLSQDSETTYQWINQETIPSFLTMEIVNRNFIFRYSYEKDQTLLNIKTLITPGEAVTRLKNRLLTIGFYPDDIKEGRSIAVYYRYSPPNLIRVSSLSETDFVKVSLLRREINELPILPPNPYDANISALVSKSSGGKSIVELNYTYFPIDHEVWGTYPLKDVTQAWDELKNGQGFIANLGENASGEITIRRVFLAYFDPHNHQNYLQPIFVFEGDKEFAAYVPAISSELVEEEE
jgi:hypothetical protein